MMAEVSWPWLYVPGPDASKELTEAHKELVEDEADLADLDFTQEDFPVRVVGCVAYLAGAVVEKSPEDVDNDFEVNFKQQVIKLPTFVANCYSIDSCVKADHIRYVSIVGGVIQEVSCNDQVLLLSIWKPNGQDIVNVYLRLPGIKETLILASSVMKLLYEGSGKSQVRLKAFTMICTGELLVSTCSVEERDARELSEFEKGLNMTTENKKSNGHTGTLESDAVVSQAAKKENDDFKPLEEKKQIFRLDEESLSLFEHELCPKSIIDFRFYQESQENAIDVIYVSNTTGELEIEQQQKVFYFKSANEDPLADEKFAKLSKVLREGKIKPKPKEAFEGLKSFAKFIENQMPKPKPTANGSDFNGGKPSDAKFGSSPGHQQTPKWLTLLESGSHLNDGDEDLQVMWFQAEHEIEACQKLDLKSDVNIDASGTDPNSYDHLLTFVEQIRDKLMNSDYPAALILLRNVKSMFCTTLLKTVTSLNEVELLKRIFFVTE